MRQTSLVLLFKCEAGGHTDHRRQISDIVLPPNLRIPFTVRQIKIVAMKEEAVRNGLAAGNHYHTVKSNRHELFIAAGPADKVLFRARVRVNELLQDFELRNGDGCLILPTVSHAFIPDADGAVLYGLSNLPYDETHDVPDKLF